MAERSVNMLHWLHSLLPQNRLLEITDREAHEIIKAQKENTGKLARALLDRETLTKDEVLQLLTRASAAISAGEDLALA